MFYAYVCVCMYAWGFATLYPADTSNRIDGVISGYPLAFYATYYWGSSNSKAKRKKKIRPSSSKRKIMEIEYQQIKSSFTNDGKVNGETKILRELREQ